MKTLLRISPLLFGAACLTAGSAALSDARTAAYAHSDEDDTHVQVLDHDNIEMRDGDVFITADDGSVARISPLGDLDIRGKAVAVSPSQRQLLQRYAAGIHDIQDRGMEIGQHAVQMVGGMLGTLVSSLFEDGGDHDLDQRMKAKAEPLKEEARALCKDVKSEKQVQDAIASSLPAFQPYAVIEPHPEHSCHIDGDEV
ncbi:MAG TPA: hypothetical protein VH327_08360 [Gammaproteobacteria bacterium]|jgi:hypothetical protein|nr:hypothetical protein [Gammaproteobacteria bacterium]